MRLVVLLCLLAAPVLAEPVVAEPVIVEPVLAEPMLAEDAVPVPSGQAVTFLDAILNEAGPEGQTARFRFVAPAIAQEVDFDTAVADMQHLCEKFALPRVLGTGPLPQQIVISLSAAPVVFGEPAPDVTQFFEAYSLEDGACIWEVF
jgi:hypothetical protein